jgi:AraC-like DNA-binding protein
MDLVFIGRDLPHAFVSDMTIPEDNFKSVIIQFRDDTIGPENLRKPEFRNIRHLFIEASRGVSFSQDTAHKILLKIHTGETSSGLRAWIDLLDIIDTLGKAGIQNYLSSEGFRPSVSVADPPRIDRIYNFIFQNYSDGISLSEAAAVANLSVPAFCRFFKQTSGKTFVEYLNVVRVGAACKLLIQTGSPISNICYFAGFNNLSNFNRQFFAAKHMSPREYRRLYNRQFDRSAGSSEAGGR